MSKKLIALFAAVLMIAMCFTACVGSQETSTPDDTTSTTTTAPADPGVTDPTDPGVTDPTDPGDPTEPGVTDPADPTDPGRPTRPPTTTVLVKVTTTAFTTVPEENRTLAPDKPEDMDGYGFKFTSSWLPKRTDANITLFEQQLFDRADDVAEDYNCSINFSSLWAGPSELQTFIQAERNPADIMEGMVGSQFYPCVGAGYLKSWTDYTKEGLINTADARWIDSYTELGRYPLDGAIYGMQFMRPAEVRFCVVFNKTLIKSAGLDPNALYDAVYAKTWDYDMLRDYALKITKDTDGNGTTDVWGMTGQYSYMMYSFVWANGGRILDVVNGIVTSTMSSSKVINGAEYFDKLVNDDKVVYFPEAFYSEDTWSASGSYDAVAEFLKGNTGFLFYESWVINHQVRPNAKFDYGMLPLPKGPDATSYVTPSENARLCYISITNKNAEKSVKIFNALARPLNDLVDYSEDLQAEYFQDNDTKSKDIYYFCLKNAVCDLGSGVSALGTELTHGLARTIFWHQTTPTAAIQAMDGSHADEIAAIYAPKKG